MQRSGTESGKPNHDMNFERGYMLSSRRQPCQRRSRGGGGDKEGYEDTQEELEERQKKQERQEEQEIRKTGERRNRRQENRTRDRKKKKTGKTGGGTGKTGRDKKNRRHRRNRTRNRRNKRKRRRDRINRRKRDCHTCKWSVIPAAHLCINDQVCSFHSPPLARRSILRLKKRKGIAERRLGRHTALSDKESG